MSSSHRYPRSARLNEVMLEVLADEVERLSDPRLGFVTLTGMEINRDLSKAAVYYSTLGGTQVAASGTDPVATAAALASAAPHLRTVLGREIRAKRVPKLEFVEDPAIATGERIETILRNIRDRDQDAGESGEA